MAYLYRYDGAKLERADAPGPRLLRWVAWRPDGSEALLVGNGGAALLWDGARYRALATGTRHNLRGAAWAPDRGLAAIVGNRGAILLTDGESVREIPSPTVENLRRVAWRPDGAWALVVGNGGTALRLDREGGVEPIPGDRAHTLRAASWRPDGAYALVAAYGSSWAGYPRPHPLYRCDGRYLQAMFASDDEDDFVAVDWRPDGREALIAGYAYRRDGGVVNKVLFYDGHGFRTSLIEAPGLLWGAAWRPGTAEALLLGEQGRLIRYADGRFDPVDSGTQDNLVGPFWRPDGVCALILKGPEERVYTV
ncbi:MAG TPA: hypothetical protein VNN12_01395 [Dehalococcoidia bacterium]|nr:hypothetical protein [Dehalococcoidia bacterium]